MKDVVFSSTLSRRWSENKCFRPQNRRGRVHNKSSRCLYTINKSTIQCKQSLCKHTYACTHTQTPTHTFPNGMSVLCRSLLPSNGHASNCSWGSEAVRRCYVGETTLRCLQTLQTVTFPITHHTDTKLCIDIDFP